MGQGTPGGLNRRAQDGEKKFAARVGRKKRKQKGPVAASPLPVVTPDTKCSLRLLKLERIKDYLLMEEEFIATQERLKLQEDKNEEDRSKVDDSRGTPMRVGNLEEPGCPVLMHNKVLSVVGLLQDEVDPMMKVEKAHVDPMVFMMKVEKAPLESYTDIGGLDSQIQEIKKLGET